jgi:hypothetical protein
MKTLSSLDEFLVSVGAVKKTVSGRKRWHGEKPVDLYGFIWRDSCCSACLKHGLHCQNFM